MRWIMCAALLGLGGCCDPGPSFSAAPDLSASNLEACPAGAEAASTAKCSFGKDSECQSTFGYVCRCLCDGYWECDQVKRVCDSDGGMPRD